MLRSTLVILAASCTFACSHLSEKTGKSAEEDFNVAMSEFQNKDWIEAQKSFDFVRLKYPYSKYAALSELRIADIKFEEDKFIEAAEAYRHFVKMHPTHENVDYAAFRIAESSWKNAPSRFFILPPDYEKDLSDVRAAAKAFQDFISGYPDSKYVPESKKLLAEANAKLAEHEWYVAEFYRKRDRWAGVAVRLEGLVNDFPNSKYEPQALMQLADAYVRLNDRQRAQLALKMLIEKHPQDPRRAEAEKLLVQLR